MSSWTLRRLLVAIATSVSLIVLAVLWMVSKQYRDFALETLDDSVASTAGFLVAQRTGAVFDERLTSIASNNARDRYLIDSASSGDAETATVAADAFFNLAEVVQGQLSLVQVVVYDKQMRKIATASKGQGVGLAEHTETLSALNDRDKAEKRKPATIRWRDDRGRPLHSTIAPIGGFKMAGFVELVTDPLGTLDGVADVLGGTLAILAPDGTVFFEQEPSSTSMVASEGSDAVADRDPLVENTSEQAQAVEAETAEIPAIADENLALHEVALTVNNQAGDPWADVRVRIDRRAFVEAARSTRNNAMFAIIGTILASIIVGWLLLRAVVFRKLGMFADAMRRIAAEERDVAVPPTGPDEFAIMAKALEALAEKVEETLRLQAERVDAHEQAALERRRSRKELARTFHQEIGSILETFASSGRDLEKRAGEVSAIAARVDQLSEASVGASAATQDAMAGVDASTAEMRKAIVQIDERVGRSREITGLAVGHIGDADASVRELGRVVESISGAVTLISEIASRTNLLALNASIEAARAGDSGRGFAVVASEVKALAAQTTSATQQIDDLIAAVSGATAQTIGAIDTARDTMGEIRVISDEVEASVAEQERVAERITAHVQEATAQMEVTTRSAQDVNDVAGETNAAAEAVDGTTQTLNQQTTNLKSRVENLIQGLEHQTG